MTRFNFRSDNESGAASEILDAVVRANSGAAHAYGDDALTARLERRFAEVFETELEVLLLATGTAANALAIAAACPPYGATYCHRHAHLYTDECGAPEHASGGAKLIAVDGPHAKIEPAALSEVLAGAGELGDHECLPSALSISQLTEFGAAYSIDELHTLTGIAREHELAVHMDGARFANALVRLGSSPAALSWRSGVQMLSFGATKNGALAAEALLVFEPALAADLGRRRKRAGHLLSKMRFVAAQLDAYLENDLWLKLASRANAAADELARVLTRLPGSGLAHPVEGNEVFVRLPDAQVEGLRAGGVEFHRWPATRDLYRFVASFNTDRAMLEGIAEVVERLRQN